MKQKLFLIITLVATCTLVSLDFSQKRLDKLYEKDKDKCLKVASRHMRWFKKNPAPYYYAALVLNDRVDNQSEVKKKYSDMYKSLGYAIKFEKMTSTAYKSKVDWYKKLDLLVKKAREVINLLDEEGLCSQSERMVKRLERLDHEVEDVPNELEIDEVPDGTHHEGEYYGLAKGTEDIPSYSVGSEKELLRLINKLRKQKGLQELEMDSDLTRAARYHAFDMGSQNYFSHPSQDRIDGKLYKVANTWDRIKQFYKASFPTTENIAAGSSMAKGTYDQWHNSPGHYQNMLSEGSSKVGIGFCRVPHSTYAYYWVFCTAT
jgi:uncharacterized protein YkwD